MVARTGSTLQLIPLRDPGLAPVSHRSAVLVPHHYLRARTARQRARQTWRGFGARTEEEAYGYWVQQFRRLMGVTIVREFARLRIRRVPFLGVPREFVRDRARGRRVVQEVPAHGRHAGDFFGHQGRMFHR